VRRPRSADVDSASRSGVDRQDPAPNSGCVRALHRPDLTSRRAPHDGAVVLAHRHAHHDDEACRSTREHPPSAANTVRAAQDSLLLTNQERSKPSENILLRGIVDDVDRSEYALELFAQANGATGEGCVRVAGPGSVCVDAMCVGAAPCKGADKSAGVGVDGSVASVAQAACSR
jgi:hypothetical protein